MQRKAKYVENVAIKITNILKILLVFSYLCKSTNLLNLYFYGKVYTFTQNITDVYIFKQNNYDGNKSRNLHFYGKHKNMMKILRIYKMYNFVRNVTDIYIQIENILWESMMNFRFYTKTTKYVENVAVNYIFMWNITNMLRTFRDIFILMQNLKDVEMLLMFTFWWQRQQISSKYYGYFHSYAININLLKYWIYSIFFIDQCINLYWLLLIFTFACRRDKIWWK